MTSTAPLNGDGAPPVRADPMPGEPWTELGYARRLVLLYGDRLRYVAEWEKWLVWRGDRWDRDITRQSHRWMKSIARRMWADAHAIEDEQLRKSMEAAARKAESAHAIRGALALAATEKQVIVSTEDLDADPFLLNCTNGTLDLRTMRLRPHNPADLLTKITRAAYVPGADGPEFGRFLDRVQPDPEMRGYLGRVLGHAVEGRVTEHILPIFHGTGRNGKGTLIGAVLAALGDYGDAADPELLTARTFEAHPTGIADLFGKRLAVLHESDRGRHLAEGTVKRLTGGDRVKARRMREDFWYFDPTHTFVLLTNHQPSVSGTDEAIWARIRLIPWDVEIPADERDVRLPDKLALELEAVLAWVLAGYADWREAGLREPGPVLAATALYRAASDAIGRFLNERTMDHGTVGSRDLFRAWEAWCKDEGEEPGSQTAFSLTLDRKGYDRYVAEGRKRWRGLGLTDFNGEG